MTRRLSLAGQLLALQVVIIFVVLVGVTAVTVAQSTLGAQEFEGRRAQAVAETLAGSRALRNSLADGGVAYAPIAAETARSNSGSASVVVALPDRTVIASADPGELGRRYDVGDSPVLEGDGWLGERAVLEGVPERPRAGQRLGDRLRPATLELLGAQRRLGHRHRRDTDEDDEDDHDLERQQLAGQREPPGHVLLLTSVGGARQVQHGAPPGETVDTTTTKLIAHARVTRATAFSIFR